MIRKKFIGVTNINGFSVEVTGRIQWSTYLLLDYLVRTISK